MAARWFGLTERLDDPCLAPIATGYWRNANKVLAGFVRKTDTVLRMKSPLYILKLICLTVIQLAKQVWLLPETVAANFRKRRSRTEVNEMEAERLDRIRHPSKYLGK